jgi:hypothetical protein
LLLNLFGINFDFDRIIAKCIESVNFSVKEYGKLGHGLRNEIESSYFSSDILQISVFFFFWGGGGCCFNCMCPGLLMEGACLCYKPFFRLETSLIYVDLKIIRSSPS